MNRAFVIIGIPTVAVATLYADVLWGHWVAMTVAVVLTLAVVVVARLEARHRRAAEQLTSGHDRTPMAH